MCLFYNMLSMDCVLTAQFWVEVLGSSWDKNDFEKSSKLDLDCAFWKQFFEVFFKVIKKKIKKKTAKNMVLL